MFVGIRTAKRTLCRYTFVSLLLNKRRKRSFLSFFRTKLCSCFAAFVFSFFVLVFIINNSFYNALIFPII
uniref:Uncharacterized protein n=1 Tax=Meloidogyne enterolobii TaxID=390850 RepID=A0A6V7V748_MELEN|nr:unnamed protein product [Meloidogyne enterolobii]